MRPSRALPRTPAFLILSMVILLVLAVGWHQEISARYPLADLPRVDPAVMEEQVRSGNVSRTEARYYRMMHAGSDTAEIR